MRQRNISSTFDRATAGRLPQRFRYQANQSTSREIFRLMEGTEGGRGEGRRRGRGRGEREGGGRRERGERGGRGGGVLQKNAVSPCCHSMPICLCHILSWSLSVSPNPPPHSILVILPSFLLRFLLTPLLSSSLFANLSDNYRNGF